MGRHPRARPPLPQAPPLVLTGHGLSSGLSEMRWAPMGGPNKLLLLWVAAQDTPRTGWEQKAPPSLLCRPRSASWGPGLWAPIGA